MTARQYIGRFSIFVVIGLCIITILCYFFDTYYPPFPKEHFGLAQMLDRAGEIETLSLGNSHACGVDMGIISSKGYSMWQEGNDLFETGYKIRNILSRLPHVHTVFINISYFTFFADNGTVSKDRAFFSKDQYSDLLKRHPGIDSVVKFIGIKDYFYVDIDKIEGQQKNRIGKVLDELSKHTRDDQTNRRINYAIIKSFPWIKGDGRNYLSGITAPIVRKDHGRDILNSLISGAAPYGQTGDKNTYFKMDSYGQPQDEVWNRNLAREKMIDDTRNNIVPRHTYITYEWLNNNPDIAKKTYEEIIGIIQYLKKRHIRLVLYTPPFYSEYTRHYNKQFISTMKDNMAALQKHFSVEYYDFSTEHEISSNETYFLNGDHLNKSGSIKFSEKLRKCLGNGYVSSFL